LLGHQPHQAILEGITEYLIIKIPDLKPILLTSHYDKTTNHYYHWRLNGKTTIAYIKGKNLITKNHTISIYELSNPEFLHKLLDDLRPDERP